MKGYVGRQATVATQLKTELEEGIKEVAAMCLIAEVEGFCPLECEGEY